MERKTIFLALFSAFVACFFVACSNDSDALDINTIDVKAGTRSVGLSSYMTREEIQDRLDEIGEKYAETIVLVDDADTTKVTEEFFIWIESLYQNDNKKKAIEVGTTVIDDEQIDEITISEIGTYATTGEENVTASGSSNIEHEYNVKVKGVSYKDKITVTIEWETNTMHANKASGAITSKNVNSSLKYSLSNWMYRISGELSKPSVSYAYDISGVYDDSTYVFKKYASVL